MDRTVSVIIPIYNEINRLRRCVNSVIAQTYEDLDIILVDDGSTDGSACICDEYAKNDARVRVVHQTNRGLSAARNTGIDLSSAPFIQFVDSDDYLLPTMTEDLMTALLSENATASQCNYSVLSDALTYKYRKEDPNFSENHRSTYRGRDIPYLLLKHLSPTVVQWNKLFRREIFDDLRYPIGKYHEDEFVIHRELAKMESLTWIDKKLYCYVHHSGSIMDSDNPEKGIHACEAYLDRVMFFSENDYTDIAAATYLRLINMISLQMKSVKNYPNADVLQEKLKLIQKEAGQVSENYFPWREFSK